METDTSYVEKFPENQRQAIILTTVHSPFVKFLSIPIYYGDLPLINLRRCR